MEFAEHRITVNAYAPGTIETPMGKSFRIIIWCSLSLLPVEEIASDIKGSKYDPKGDWLNDVCNTQLYPHILNLYTFFQKIQGIPLKSLGTPEDIAGLVSYLASEESRFVTGGSFVVCDA